MNPLRATFQTHLGKSRKKGLRRKAEIPFIISMVPKGGLEPPRVSPPPPQDGVSTRFHHFGTQGNSSYPRSGGKASGEQDSGERGSSKGGSFGEVGGESPPIAVKYPPPHILSA